MFKHLFEVEFGIRAAVEILIFIVIVSILVSICCKLMIRIGRFGGFLYRELIAPLYVRFYEKLAFSTNNPNWQERANKIKDTFRQGEDESGGHDKTSVKKSNAGRWILMYLVVAAWIIGLHYWGEENRSNYEVFFLGEDVVLAFEEWTVEELFDTDECAIECFFHNQTESGHERRSRIQTSFSSTVPIAVSNRS